ncbi:hypothetical protein F5Y16DRAFT_399163 [Xylariaceae sp. FL0255]|nr:hypothetical protein F5Y16DRAFT_399163 [Xylariaceae sp. FL0255]
MNLLSVYNHLVLPPQVPGGPDQDIDLISAEIIRRMLRACTTVNVAAARHELPLTNTYDSLVTSLEACLELNHGRLEKRTLLSHFQKLPSTGVLVLHINEQNAGLLIRRDLHEGEPGVIFESLELSAKAEQILAAGQAVLWDFPGRCARISMSQFEDGAFQECLTTFLEQASMETLYSVQAFSKKAGVPVVEGRDTTSPALITQMLMSVLEAMGSSVQPPSLRKKVRDDINLEEGYDVPWRRLPLWLLLRVAVQKHCCLSLGNEQGQASYKALMAVLFSQLLDDSNKFLRPQPVNLLRAKLARRMVKMETSNKSWGIYSSSLSYESWLGNISSIVKESIDAASNTVQSIWDSYRQTSLRPVPRLPQRVLASESRLELQNSGIYLENILSRTEVSSSSLGPISLPNPLEQGMARMQKFTDQVHGLAELENTIDQQPSRAGANTNAADCLHLANQIDHVLEAMKPIYTSHPEHMSGMLLSLFTLWVDLDKCVIEKYPLLREYRPVFKPEILDALQLPTKKAMGQLHRIQDYLSERHGKSDLDTILDISNDDCLAVRYCKQSNSMRRLEDEIQSASDEAQEKTRRELRKLHDKYDELTQKIASLECLCTYTIDRNGEVQRNIDDCKKCYEWRQRKNLQIEVQEAYLPTHQPARSLVVFELAIPALISVYRDATWRILSELAHPSRPRVIGAPEINLVDCGIFRRFTRANARRLSLSSTIKCFVQTHYRFNNGKVPLTAVVLPFAADFRLYDYVGKIWVEGLTLPLTLEHHCGLSLPQILTTVIPPTMHPPPIAEGPSSYEIQANQAQCPTSVSLHEFSALQKVMAGSRRRWPNILTELSSSNLNVSNEETVTLLCQLAVQAGPRLPHEPLRAVHEIFKYQVFTKKLLEIIENRLRSIETNWREHTCMELLLTLTLRFISLEPSPQALSLLYQARKSLLGWIKQIQGEVRGASDPTAVKRFANYGLHAALLCRRTFAIYMGCEHSISSDDVIAWLKSSLALQENALDDITDLNTPLSRVLIRDAQISFRIQDQIKTVMRDYRSVVGLALEECGYSLSNTGAGTVFLSWDFLPVELCNGRWIVATTDGPHPQRVHFNFIEGHLLVNGKTRGKLPVAIGQDEEVKRIFAKHHLLTYESSLPGMSHKFSQRIEGLEVHFGLRDRKAVIRTLRLNAASRKTEVLEFVPERVFRSETSFDIPTELMENCAHWLNLTTKSLEIRRASPGSWQFWKTRDSDWILEVHNRRAIRRKKNLNHSVLVAPHSTTFGTVAKTFQHFTTPDRLTVYQAQRGGKLSVTLKHMDLRFEVNSNNLLECHQLNAEIDPDQDAGCWYGLLSKIVVRDTKTGKRSVIVPLGVPIPTRRGSNVECIVENAGDYGRFTIDDVLGKLTCPPEPRLVYTKALYYAATSFCLPDPLTQNTGTEEAFDILRSSAAQPWSALSRGTSRIFDAFDSLTPKRVYHPSDIRYVQRVTWDPIWTSSIQHDGFKPIIESIKQTSNKIGRFHAGEALETSTPTHLCLRGIFQRSLYERPILKRVSEEGDISSQTTYEPRDRDATVMANQVYKITRAIVSDCRLFNMETPLVNLLERYDVIGGFHDENDRGEVTLASRPLYTQVVAPINEQWGQLVNFCRRSKSKPALFFSLGLLAFNKNADMDMIFALSAIGCMDELRALEPPDEEVFAKFADRDCLSLELLGKLMIPAYPKFVPKRRGEDKDVHGRTSKSHESACWDIRDTIAGLAFTMWPMPGDHLTEAVTNFVEADSIARELGLNSSSLLEGIIPDWERRLAAMKLENYAQQLQKVIDSKVFRQDLAATAEWKLKDPKFATGVRPHIVQSVLAQILESMGSVPNMRTKELVDLSGMDLPRRAQDMRSREQVPELEELNRILSRFAKTKDRVRLSYVEGLQDSLVALKEVSWTEDHREQAMKDVMFLDIVQKGLKSMEAHVNYQFKQIIATITAHEPRYGWLQSGGIQPLATRKALLQLLRSTAKPKINTEFARDIVQYGTDIALLQRLRRIKYALLQQDQRALSDELRYRPHKSWSPLDTPDWLLMELDGDILIRPEQVDVARAIIAPESGENTVLQMNMGKGKTSCIVPMAICILADGRKISRLLVPKALIMQTAQMLQTRLGGLVGRDVYSMPFSRRTPTTPTTMGLYEALHHDAFYRHAVILTCHEHVLSYKLCGWQKLADNDMMVAKRMLSFQTWLDSHCRDVLDECDFTLSVKTQLNYPSGAELPVDGHPYRWQVAEEMLDLVASHLPELHRRYPRSIEVRQNEKVSFKDSFPVVHFLRKDVEDALHKLIIQDISLGRTKFLSASISDFKQYTKAIENVLYGSNIDDNQLSIIASLFPNPSAATNVLLLMRGLLKNRILVTCLGKRWNVQYGLHPGRHPVAVPFEAKGKPSEQAEYGHPDVAILFTCLSFYYGGLSPQQLVQSVQHILQSDDPAAQYEGWISGCTHLPDALSHWNTVNSDDQGQMEQLWKHLKNNRIVVDHYLNYFVFPAHCRQFERKLQACSWDLPLVSSNSENVARSTGFSGTNDNRMMLPLTINQKDLPSLKHTSAEVLSYLLQPRNRCYFVMTHPSGARWSEKDLLKNLHGFGIRVLIDSGAYVLEMSNEGLAREWLNADPEADAAIFFGADDRAWVKFRSLTKVDVPLLATPFSDDMSKCVVYLDEAHTRGVDLNLPSNARGAVTLALKQTKDFTVQAAMRLRQLRTTQSVAFFGPPEVTQSISDLCHLDATRKLNSSHVVYWLLEQTCRSIEDLQILYVAQGIDFCRRTDAIWRYKDYITNVDQQRYILQILKQPERQTLKKLYGPTPNKIGQTARRPLHSSALQGFMKLLTQSANGRQDAGEGSAMEEVEQEREVELQVEQVRQVQQRTLFQALEFPGVHKAIRQFAITGRLSNSTVTGESGFEHAFTWVSKSGIGKKFHVQETSSRLFVSSEFGKTIKTSSDTREEDNFLRPVQWVLWSPDTETALIIIPEEAEWFLERSEDPQFVAASSVHLISYAPAVTKSMLQYTPYIRPSLPESYSFPDWFARDVGILAGRLYVDQAEWPHLTQYIKGTQAANGDLDRIAPDPAAFLLEWLTLRRKAADILHTPMGYICTGRRMEDDSRATVDAVTSDGGFCESSADVPVSDETSDIESLDGEWDNVGNEVVEQSMPGVWADVGGQKAVPQS